MSGGAWARAALGVATLAGSALGCAQRQAWQHDESWRIDEVISSKASDDLSDLSGTSFAAPPSNAPPLATRTYEIQPPKKRQKPHRNTRTTKRRSGREGDLTSPDVGGDSASPRP